VPDVIPTGGADLLRIKRIKKQIHAGGGSIYPMAVHDVGTIRS
jgi:hypothetical protein